VNSTVLIEVARQACRTDQSAGSVHCVLDIGIGGPRPVEHLPQQAAIGEKKPGGQVRHLDVVAQRRNGQVPDRAADYDLDHQPVVMIRE
jgi:hypothetical protein